jgi:hypothetical protein
MSEVYVFRLGEAYDDLEPVFSVDGRDYPDAETLRADVRAASEALRERNLIADFETSVVLPGAPGTGLPSWREWRARHIDGDEPIGVRPLPLGRDTPPGWDAMGRWLERSQAWLNAQVAAAAGAVGGGRVELLADVGPRRVSRGSVVLTEEQYRVGCDYLVAPPAGRSGRDALGEITAWLRANGWTLEAPVETAASTTVGASNAGHRIDAVWSHRGSAVTLLGASPTVDARYFDQREGAGGAADV